MDNNIANDKIKAEEQIKKAFDNMKSTSYNEEQAERLMEDFGGVDTGVGSPIDPNDERLKEADKQVQEVFENNGVNLFELNMECHGGVPTGKEDEPTNSLVRK